MSTRKPTFEEAMNATIHWCNAWEEGELSDEVLADRMSELLKSKTGARGFFVISLASDCPLMDRLPDALVLELRRAGDLVINLTVKNLAMSSAMAVHHKRDRNTNFKVQSERVTARCIELLRQLEPNEVKNQLEDLLDGIKGFGDSVEFLKRWNYDDEQKEAIASSIYGIAESKS